MKKHHNSVNPPRHPSSRERTFTAIKLHRSPIKDFIQKRFLSNLKSSHEKMRFTTNTFRRNLNMVSRRNRKNQSMALVSDFKGGSCPLNMQDPYSRREPSLFNKSSETTGHKNFIDNIMINCSQALIGDHKIYPLTVSHEKSKLFDDKSMFLALKLTI